MKHLVYIFVCLFAFTGCSLNKEKEVRLKLVQTSDVHGNFYPYDFIRKRDGEGGLSRVSAYVKEMRKDYGKNLLLMDNGDLLQGQPTAYYYNFIDTVSVHLMAQMLNYMGYDAASMGNHDVETGHSVYDRWASQCKFPVLGANIVRESDGEPYLKPYLVVKRNGLRIAILGMITPAVPNWLPEKLWKGLRFEDMEETARRWMPVLRDKEKADIVIGLFHAGVNPVLVSEQYRENASVTVAQQVPGFDVVFAGHDHQTHCYKVENVEGDSVLILDPGSRANVVSSVDLVLKVRKGKVVSKDVTGELVDMNQYAPDEEFMQKFATQREEVQHFVSKEIGTFTNGITTKQAYFGPSAFVDFIHEMQLKLTGADVSFVAPLSLAAEIPAGKVTVADMFNLYRYENMLYTMRLSGKEIKGMLEMSYAMWTNQMKNANDHLLLLEQNKKGKYQFVNFSYNFDSAAGIYYTVDVTKPAGSKVIIEKMADGRPFDENAYYKVALNSYRGNGGGELLTKGAGIPHDQLTERILDSTDKDLRYYMMEYIEQQQTLDPKPLNQWKFIPEKWVKPAAERDYRLLFGDNK